MLNKLFGTREGADAAAPEGLRLYAVGDVHGRLDLLDRLLALIAAETSAAAKRLIFLGDYVDRGPDSRGVIERLVEIAARAPDSVFIRGNHEAILLSFLEDPDRFADWFEWGGVETLESYGVPAEATAAPKEAAAALAASMPATHLAFLRGLPLSATFGDYFFVHAGVRPGVALDAQAERDLLWIRGEFHNAPADKRPDKVIVHGHHPIRRPLDAGWRIAVDTGACFSDKLTAAVLEGSTRRFLST